VPGYLGGLAKPVPHRVRVHEEQPRTRLEHPAGLEVGLDGLEQRTPRLLERPGDLVDELPLGLGVPGERPLGQQFGGPHGPRRGRPGDNGTKPGKRLTRTAVGVSDVGHSRPSDHGPVPKRGGHLGEHVRVIGLTSENNKKPRPLHPEKNGPVGPSSPTTNPVEHGRRIIRGRVANKHGGGFIKIPPKSSGTGEQGLLGVSPHNGINNGGLKPSIPSTTGLGSGGVGHGGGESDLPPIPKNSLGKHPPLVLISGEERHLLLNDVHSNTNKLNGLPKRDPPRKIPRRLPKSIGSEPNGLPLIPKIGGEPSSPSLSNQLNRRPLISRHPPKPGKLLIHRSKRSRSQLPRSTIKRRKSNQRHLNHAPTV
jgi:hypothetical protein